MFQEHKFLFVGDVVLHTKPEFSSELKQLFEDADIKCCNFEAPLRGFGKPVSKTGPLVDQSDDAPELLLDFGFNLFALANNHICDFGEHGLLGTLKKFPQERVIGVGTHEQAYQMKEYVIDGVKYGFVAYGENGYGALNGDRDIGYAWVNHDQVKDDIKRYGASVDFLIVQIHAGVEMLDVPIPEWRKRYYELIDLGADVVIGHHPHIVQGMESYKDKLIYYSLGNFYFDYETSHPEWNRGGILELRIQDGNIKQHKLHIVEKHNNLLILKNNTDSEAALKILNAKLEEPYYTEYVNKQAIYLWSKHHKSYYGKAVNGMVDYSIIGILKYIKRILFHKRIDYSMLWHNLFIESNIWIVQRAIRLLNK